jgi:hypothetical protein
MLSRSLATLIRVAISTFGCAIALGAGPAHATNGWTGEHCQSAAYACVGGGYQATAATTGATTGNSWAWRYYGEEGAKGIQTASGPHNCTLYVAWRLQQNGMQDPKTAWGNAAGWTQYYAANAPPTVGSVAWWGSAYASGFGHVAYVEQVSGNQVFVRADNYVQAGGYTDSGWISVSSVQGFLHPYPAGEKTPAPAKPTKPGQPFKPTATRAGTTRTINVSWPAVAGATKYRLQWSTNGGSSWKSTTANGPLKALKGSFGSTYIFQVQAYNKAGWGPYSPYSNAVLLNRIPPAQPTPTATLSGKTITLSWPAVPGATKYHTQWSADGGRTWNSGRIGSATSGKYTGAFTVTYIFQVQAYNADGGWGAYSAYSNPVTVSGPPPQPGQLSASPSGTTINLAWSGVPGATKYRYQWSNDGGASWHITGTGGAQYMTARFGGQPGKTYIFQVQAGNDAAWGAFSAYSNAVTL